MKRTSIYLTDEQHEQLSDMAQSSGKTVSEYVRMAIDAYLSSDTGTLKEISEKLDRLLNVLEPGK